MTELKKYKLGDLLDVKRGASLSGEYYATKGQFVRLTCGNFDYNQNCFKENTSKDNIYYIGQVRPEFIMKKGDIITPLTEQAIGLLGSTAIIPESGKYIQSQDVAKIICKEGKLYPAFAFYLVSSAMVKYQLSAGAQQTKIRHTSPDKIKDCSVWIPDYENQKRIASVLSAIDEKIALNRRINDRLEQTARDLYDYWFLQFDFPDANGNPYRTSGGAMTYNATLKREIPVGWKVENIFSAVNVLYGYPFATEYFVENETPVPVVRIRDILEGKTSAYSTEVIDSKYLLQEGDVLIGMDGNFHMNFWHTHTDYLNQRCLRLRPYSGSSISSLQVFFDTKPIIKAREKSIKGSTVAHLSDKDIKSIYLVVPKETETFQPRKHFDAIMQQIIFNRNEIYQLLSLRDQLLPLLMNGQVSIEK